MTARPHAILPEAFSRFGAFALLDALRDMVVVADREGRILYVNDAVAATLGWRAADLVGAPLAQLVPARMRDQHRHGFAAHVAGGPPTILGGPPIAVPALHADGREVEVELSLSEHWVEGTPCVLGLLRDTSTRRRMEHAESLSGYLALAGEISSRVALVNDLASVEEAGKVILETVGEMLGWDAAVLWEVGDDDISRPAGSWSSSALADGMAELADPRHSFPSGRGLPGRVVARRVPAWIEDVANDPDFPRHVIARRHGITTAFAFPIQGASRVLAVVELLRRQRIQVDTELLGIVGQVGGTVGQFLERRIAAEEIATTRARKAAILDSAFDAVVSIDQAGTIIEWNRAAERTFGWTATEAIGQPMASLIIPKSQRGAHNDGLARHLRTGEIRVIGRPVELTAQRRDGVEFPVEVAITRLDDVDPPEFTGFLRDISERKRVERYAAENHERLRSVVEILQESLLPDALPEVPGLDVGAAYRPAGDGTLIGGDFYDLLQVDEGRWVAFIGDVCGKGPAAARITALVRYTLRAAALDSGLLEAVEHCNTAVLAHPDSRFVTAVHLEVEVGDARSRISSVRAGHPEPLVLRANGDVESVSGTGTLLGVVEDPRFAVTETWLEPGDAMILFTDGVTEAPVDDRLLGEEGLVGLLQEVGGADAATIAEHVCERVVDLQNGETRDDVAVLVLRQPPAG